MEDKDSLWYSVLCAYYGQEGGAYVLSGVMVQFGGKL